MPPSISSCPSDCQSRPSAREDLTRRYSGPPTCIRVFASVTQRRSMRRHWSAAGSMKLRRREWQRDLLSGTRLRNEAGQRGGPHQRPRVWGAASRRRGRLPPLTREMRAPPTRRGRPPRCPPCQRQRVRSGDAFGRSETAARSPPRGDPRRARGAQRGRAAGLSETRGWLPWGTVKAAPSLSPCSRRCATRPSRKKPGEPVRDRGRRRGVGARPERVAHWGGGSAREWAGTHLGSGGEEGEEVGEGDFEVDARDGLAVLERRDAERRKQPLRVVRVKRRPQLW